MPHIRVIPPEQAEGALEEAYARVTSDRGGIANVLRIASLQPGLLETHLALYMEIMYGEGGLSRREREMIGTAVSRANRCPYCVTHHAEALETYDTPLACAVAEDPDGAELPPRERALVRYALKLTRTPERMTAEDAAELRAQGIEDRDILAATAVAAYFNFVNRLVLGLGVELESPEERSYHY